MTGATKKNDENQGSRRWSIVYWKIVPKYLDIPSATAAISSVEKKEWDIKEGTCVGPQ